MRRFLWIAIVCIAVVLLLAVFATGRSKPAGGATPPLAPSSPAPLSTAGSADSGEKKAARADGAPDATNADGAAVPRDTAGGAAEAERANDDPFGHGRVQPVAAAGNPRAQSVLAALKSGQHPERLSILTPPREPFDRAAFEANPDAYLNLVEPGRVFQNAAPADGVPALKIRGGAYFRVEQGGRVKLAVQGAPLAPVTFTSTDLGAFEESRLSSVTVRAGQDGVAAATFVATPGTLNDVHVLAGSPLASGQARFTVDVARSGAVGGSGAGGAAK